MPVNPVYLISSLPGLSMGNPAPFSFPVFLAKAKEYLQPRETDILENISIGGAYVREGPLPSALSKWYAFDTALRKELVRLRRGHTRSAADNDIARIALAAYKNPLIIEAERFLDEQRWGFLDSLLFGHYFDLDILAVYGLKLLILQRWERAGQADREELINSYV